MVVNSQTDDLSLQLGAQPLRDRTALVWWMRVDDVAPAACWSWRAILNEEERGRAERFLMQRDRLDYVAAHALLRVMLGSVAGIQPDACRFVVGPHGKPELDPSHGRSDLSFNISHTRGAVACGIACGTRIGVDIENRARIDDPLEIATAYFAPEEIAALSAASEMDRRKLFYTLWTLKEATLKAIGQGLLVPLADVAFALAPIRLRSASAALGCDWHFVADTVTECHSLAVAVPGGGPDGVIVHRLSRADVSRLIFASASGTR